MSWIDEVRAKLKKKNQVLFSRDTEFLQDLKQLFEEQNHRVLVLWSFDFAAESISDLREKYPNENRPQEALEAAQNWASGKIKMPAAKQKILACHSFAKEIENKSDIGTIHAIGQACSVVHTVGHIMGYPFYDLTSIVYKLGIDECSDAIESRKKEYIDRLSYWSENVNNYDGEWADFMLK